MGIFDRTRARAATAIPPEEAAATAATPDEVALAGAAAMSASDERLYGTLMAANGTGALAGALLTAAFARVPRKGLVLLGSVGTFAVGLMAFALIPRVPVGARRPSS